MISREKLMNGWLFCGSYKTGMELSKDSSQFESVQLPHNPVDLPLTYFDEKIYQHKTCYRKVLPVKKAVVGGKLFIRFEAVMAHAQVWLDGEYLGEHKGGYTPFEFDITGKLGASSERLLTVVADASEECNIPPFGGQIDYLTYAGIYREVYLDEYAPVSIKNARIWSTNTLEAQPSLKADVYVDSTISSEVDVVLSMELISIADNKKIAETRISTTVDSGLSTVKISLEKLNSIQLWDIDNPYLYTVNLSISAKNKPEEKDTFTSRFGFRTVEFKADGFSLNGKKLKIRGLNRHQSWPYVGYAMPERAQKKDADILKDELSVNLVRTSHYPQSIHFLDRCDERGLLVFEEIPGWQHIGNQEWKDIAVHNVEEMITRDWNHPSIIIWGVRINESNDDNDFYTRTNELARSLDPTRQTGGVRYIDNSNLLEDVYTMNDFVHSGGEIALRNQQDVTGLKHDVPYMVTEYNGHMYPTKKTDSEERQHEHVMRHLRVQNASHENPGISGAIGWCAFDYNTHCDFGSGDRVCHHGVMDIFRLPKFAAWVYGSQVSPQVKPILKPVTHWARGERSIGGVFPLIVLSNCDSISIQYGNFDPIVINEKEPSLSHLPYPPFVIDFRHISMETVGAWGMKWEDVLFIGYVDGKEVTSFKMVKNPVISKFIAIADDTSLRAGEKDVTRVRLCVLDQYDNEIPYADVFAHIAISGPARIQGPAMLSLRTGSTAFWIETNGEKGTVNLTITSAGLETQNIKVDVI